MVDIVLVTVARMNEIVGRLTLKTFFGLGCTITTSLGVMKYAGDERRLLSCRSM